MDVLLSIGVSGYTENFILKLWEAGSDGVGQEVFTTILVEKNNLGVPTVGAGHQVTEAVVANGMDKVTHIGRIIGAVSNIEYNEFVVLPETPILTVSLPVRFKIGDGGPNTPAAADTMATTPELAGLSIGNFVIHRGGFGPMYPNVHYDFNTIDGSWNLLGGDEFSPVDEITIDIKPVLVTTVVNDSVVGKWFGGFVDVAANINYSASHLRKLIRLSGSPEYSFITAPPIGYTVAFQHFGSAGTAKVNFTIGTLLWAGVPKAFVNIPRYCEAGFVWDGINFNVVYFNDSSFVNAAVIPLGVIASGIVAIGDVPAGDPQYTVTHNKNITGDYDVFLSVKSNSAALFFRNNKIGSTWWHHSTDKPNKFNFSLQEISGEVQDLSINWAIIKLS